MWQGQILHKFFFSLCMSFLDQQQFKFNAWHIAVPKIITNVPFLDLSLAQPFNVLRKVPRFYASATQQNSFG